MKTVVPLGKAHKTDLFGAKAIGLGDAIRKGIPVPSGVAISGDLVDAIASRDKKAIKTLMKAIENLPSPFAVRSSAIDKTGPRRVLRVSILLSLTFIPRMIYPMQYAKYGGLHIRIRQ